MSNAVVKDFIQNLGLLPESRCPVRIGGLSARRRAYGTSVLEQLGYAVERDTDDVARNPARIEAGALYVGQGKHEPTAPHVQEVSGSVESKYYLVEPLTGTDLLAEIFCAAAPDLLGTSMPDARTGSRFASELAETVVKRIERSEACWGDDTFQEAFVEVASGPLLRNVTGPREYLTAPNGVSVSVVRPLICVLDWTLATNCQIKPSAYRHTELDLNGALQEPLNSMALAIVEHIEPTPMGRAKLNTYLRIIYAAYQRSL